MTAAREAIRPLAGVIERHSMHRVALFVFGVLALGSAARPDVSIGGRAQSASGGTATRQAFLKLIERPRVPLEPVTKPGSESAETVVEEISIAAEAASVCRHS
jgi:hypothetical protein